ncbi:GntR family transcriptional regulator [Micromonospora rubida]|uniref:GntR family transcriptional regulator n=1 Tax=Micromonospora rubida TaxID=2697657 RepID=A0ABW7SFQ0_9ACTN
MPTPHYGQPRYRVIADHLRRRIESGVIPPGSLLPAESMLASEFRASRGTIRQAVAALRESGLVTTEHGRGTYTNVGSYEYAPDRSAELQTRQRDVAADAELADLFDIEVGAVLIERQSVTRKGKIVETVIKAYRLPPTSEGN